MQLPAEHQQVITFLRWLHDDRRGFFCINAGVADDTTPTGIRMLLPCDDHPEVQTTRKWFYYDPERPDLLERAARYVLELEIEYGNVYTARTLFRSKSARQEYAYASPLIFLDDAPRKTPLPYSLYVDTGTGNGQAFYKLDQNTPKRDALRITRALGCDPTGSADNKLLRIPGTRNTKAKHGGNYRVGVELSTPGCYSIDRLRAAFPPAADEAETERERAAKPWDAESERRLTAVYRQVKRMLTPEGLPRVVMCSDPQNQGRRIFDDAEHIASFRHPSGSWDASTVRHIRVKALRLRWLTREQAAAVVFACEDAETIRIKGSVAVWNDIKGRVDYWWEKYPQIVVSHYSQRLQDEMLRTIDNTAPEVLTPRPVKGRPRTTPELADVLRVYQEHAENGTLHKGRRERAALLRVSTATLDRLELILRERGDIVIHTTPDRRGSTVELVGVIKIPLAEADVITPEPMAPELIATPETADASHVYAHGVTHPFVGQPSETQPTSRRSCLAKLVAEALDQPAAKLPRCRLPVVREWVNHHAPGRYTPQQVNWEYQAELERQCLKTIRTVAGLNARLRSREARAERARAEGNLKVARWWNQVCQLIRAEMARRPATPGRKPRTNCEALPDLRKAAARRQDEQWAAVEPVLAELRGARNRECVPPLSAPTAPPAPAYDASGLIARLYAKKVAPPAAAAE